MRIICCRFGDKFTQWHVDNLKHMIDEYSGLKYDSFEVIEDDLYGNWFNKFQMYDRFRDGENLYFDLDVIVFKNIDQLFTWEPNQFCIIRDFNRHIRDDWKRMNSSVFRLSTGQHQYVWDNFIKQPEINSKKMHGDQDWIYAHIKNDFKFWPDEWIQSYKWEMRGKPTMARVEGVRNFSHPGIPEIKPQTSVAVFHGEPYPHNCIDPWCKENWY